MTDQFKMGDSVTASDNGMYRYGISDAQLCKEVGFIEDVSGEGTDNPYYKVVWFKGTEIKYNYYDTSDLKLVVTSIDDLL